MYGNKTINYLCSITIHATNGSDPSTCNYHNN